MKHIKVAVSVLLVVFTLLTASCSLTKETTDLTTSSAVSEESRQYKQFDENEFYVAVGYYDNENKIRLMHFNGQSTDYVWWIQDQDQYFIGDIYVLSEEHKTQAEGRKNIDGPWEQDVFGSYTQFEKLGNCKDLMTLKTLEVTSAEEDEIEWAIYFKDTEPVSEGESGTYIFKFATFGTFGVDLQSAKPGDKYIFAFPYKNTMIPIAKVEG